MPKSPFSILLSNSQTLILSNSHFLKLSYLTAGRQTLYPVPVGFRLGDDQKMEVAHAFVCDAVFCPCGKMDALGRIDSDGLSFHFKSGRTQKDVKKLLGMLVEMGRFGSAGRHRFLYHAEAVGF